MTSQTNKINIVPCLWFNKNAEEAAKFYTQEETDRYWNAIVKNGGQEIACSWCKDKFGLSWQIVPRVLMEAMMQMVKIDIAKIEAARRG